MVEGNVNRIGIQEICVERRWFADGERKLISAVGEKNWCFCLRMISNK
jgi:hypothetical protein